MDSASRSRREILRASATVAGLGVFGSLAGCGSLFGGDGRTSGQRPIDSVPQRADVVTGVDVAAVLADGPVRRGVNGRLEELADAPGGPTTVEGLFDRIESRVGLDPRALTGLVAFAGIDSGGGATGLGVQDVYGAVTLHSDWTAKELSSALREADLAVEERTYAEQTVYAHGRGWIAALGDGRFVAGSQAAVTDAIDVVAGDGTAVTGDLRTAYESARDGYVQFALDIPQEDIGGEVGTVQDITTGVRFVSGSVSRQDDSRLVGFRVEADSGDAAEDIRALVEAGIARTAQRQRRQQGKQYVRVLEQTDVTRDGTTVQVTTEVNPATVGDVVGAVVARVVTATPVGSGHLDLSPTG